MVDLVKGLVISRASKMLQGGERAYPVPPRHLACCGWPGERILVGGGHETARKDATGSGYFVSNLRICHRISVVCIFDREPLGSWP